LIRLFPSPSKQQPLRGSYLDLGLQRGNHGAPLIYTNFISSVDGRIAIAGDDGLMQVPSAIANPRDWRLYQELAAQSDVMITSARYFRQLAQGRAQALLPVDGDDLCAWRVAQQMVEQPEILILSNSLNIPVQTLPSFSHRRITVLTAVNPDRHRQQQLIDAGAQVVGTQCRQVTGNDVRNWMATQQHKSGYAIAGCGVFHSLLIAGVLDRLFLTTHYSLLGGSRFDTLLRDDLPVPVALHLKSLYFDAEAEQTFADYTFADNTLGASHDH